MNKFVLTVVLMSMICVSYAQVYKWTDSQGVIHFSDSPHDGAQKVKIPDDQIFSPPSPKQDLPPQDEDQVGEKKQKYTTIAIVQPLNESTIRNNDGSVSVSVQLEPSLSPGDKVQLIFDGSPLGEPQPNIHFELAGIYRGSHTITVEVVNANGGVIITSDSITIYMQRPRVGMAQHG